MWGGKVGQGKLQGGSVKGIFPYKGVRREGEVTAVPLKKKVSREGEGVNKTEGKRVTKCHRLNL